MSQLVLFLLLGLGAGAIYALLGLGLVLQYRATGVVNFAQGATAMLVAYVYVELRDTGTLVFPWVGLPNELSLGSGPLATAPAIAISLAFAAVLGTVLYLVVFKALRQAPPLARVGASIGLMLAMQAVAVLNFGTDTRSTPPILPNHGVSYAGVQVPSDRLYLAALAIGLTIVLAALYRFTRFGLATRAAAENESGASLLGISPSSIGLVNWVLASVLAGLAGVLILPLVNLDPNSYTLFVIPALAVALLGRFTSFTVTAAAGLALGMVQSEIVRFETIWTWLPSGTQQALPFLIVVIAMVVLGRNIPARGTEQVIRNPSIGRPSRPGVTALAAGCVGVLALILLHGSYRAGLISSLVAICICLSFVVVTGYVGQVSLVQMAFAGIGGFALTHIVSAGVPFPLSILLAGIVAVPVGILIGLPALRVRGVNLAVVTLGAAVAFDAVVFNWSWFTGGFAGRSVSEPTLFGINLGISGASSGDYPRVIFGVVVLVIVILVGYLVARLRNSAGGRMLIALRSDERAAAAVGIDVARAKLLAFALSAFIAAVGGSLLAYQQTTLSISSFTVFSSLTFLAIAYVGGIGRISGAVVAGILLAPGGLMFTLGEHLFDIGQYQLLVAGVGLVAMSIIHPDGLSSTEVGGHGAIEPLMKLSRRFGPRPRVAAGDGR